MTSSISAKSFKYQCVIRACEKTVLVQKSKKILTFSLRFCLKKHVAQFFLSFKKKIKLFPHFQVVKTQKQFRGPRVEHARIWLSAGGLHFFESHFSQNGSNQKKKR